MRVDAADYDTDWPSVKPNKCERRGHYARMSRTRSVGAVMAMSSTSTRTIETQRDESARRKSERKRIRNRERMVEFRKQR